MDPNKSLDEQLLGYGFQDITDSEEGMKVLASFDQLVTDPRPHRVWIEQLGLTFVMDPMGARVWCLFGQFQSDHIRDVTDSAIRRSLEEARERLRKRRS